jgi:hypothetical protein
MSDTNISREQTYLDLRNKIFDIEKATLGNQYNELQNLHFEPNDLKSKMNENKLLNEIEENQKETIFNQAIQPSEEEPNKNEIISYSENDDFQEYSSKLEQFKQKYTDYQTNFINKFNEKLNKLITEQIEVNNKLKLTLQLQDNLKNLVISKIKSALLTKQQERNKEIAELLERRKKDAADAEKKKLEDKQKKLEQDNKLIDAEKDIDSKKKELENYLQLINTCVSNLDTHSNFINELLKSLNEKKELTSLEETKQKMTETLKNVSNRNNDLLNFKIQLEANIKELENFNSEIERMKDNSFNDEILENINSYNISDDQNIKSKIDENNDFVINSKKELNELIENLKKEEEDKKIEEKVEEKEEEEEKDNLNIRKIVPARNKTLDQYKKEKIGRDADANKLRSILIKLIKEKLVDLKSKNKNSEKSGDDEPTNEIEELKLKIQKLEEQLKEKEEDENKENEEHENKEIDELKIKIQNLENQIKDKEKLENEVTELKNKLDNVNKPEQKNASAQANKPNEKTSSSSTINSSTSTESESPNAINKLTSKNKKTEAEYEEESVKILIDCQKAKQKFQDNEYYDFAYAFRNLGKTLCVLKRVEPDSEETEEKNTNTQTGGFNKKELSTKQPIKIIDTDGKPVDINEFTLDLPIDQRGVNSSDDKSEAESKEESKAESKEESKAESKEESKAESKDESEEESKEESKAESDAKSKSENKELKNKIIETIQSKLKSLPKVAESKEENKEEKEEEKNLDKPNSKMLSVVMINTILDKLNEKISQQDNEVKLTNENLKDLRTDFDSKKNLKNEVLKIIKNKLKNNLTGANKQPEDEDSSLNFEAKSTDSSISSLTNPTAFNKN